MENNIKSYIEIVESTCEVFEKYFYNEYFSKKYFDTMPNNTEFHTDFSIFNIITKEYFEQTGFLDILQKELRINFINKLIDDLCKIKKIDFTYIPSRSNFDKIRDLENANDFQYLLKIEDYAVGIKYDDEFIISADQDSIYKLLNKWNLDKIFIISFNKDKDFVGVLKNVVGTYKNVSLYSFEDFIDTFFAKGLYSEIDKYVNKMLSSINDKAGFKTIRSFNYSNMAPVRLQILKEVKTNQELFVYHSIKNESMNDCIPFDDHDKQKINCRLQERVKLIIGKDDFAKSFVSSEYLFKSIKNNISFDYTSITVSYLKSVEQLLYKILLDEINNLNNQTESWIKLGRNTIFWNGKKRNPSDDDVRKNPDNKHSTVKQVKVNKRNIRYFDTSLGALIWYFYDHESLIDLSQSSKDKIKNVLIDYKETIRNGYLHKDNMYDYNKARIVRKNTIVVLLLILCSLKDMDLIEYGYTDDSYNRLFELISSYLPDSPFHSYFKITLDDSSPAELVCYLHDSSPEIYDDFGILKKPLKFIKVNSVFDRLPTSKNIPIDKIVVIDSEHIPLKLDYVKINKDLSQSTIKCFSKGE